MSEGDPVRLAMVGGGAGSFIGPVHRMAAELSGHVRLVAGAFSRDPERSAAAGRAWGVAAARTHTDYRALLADETARPDGAQLVAIATPNDLHFGIACDALRAGFHVLSDKPATLDLGQAVALAEVVAGSGRLYGLAHVYRGYPMIREARDLVAGGALGSVRKVVVEYSQGWLSRPIERHGDRQAAWRTDSTRSGEGGCVSDIGVHAFDLAEFVSGQPVTSLCADLGRVVEGRTLDDDCDVLLRFDNGARGVLVASQISAGARNGLRLRVFGEEGGLTWDHERHSELVVDWLDAPTQVLHAGSSYLGRSAASASRLPAGHPEGFIEAFANLYADFATAIAEGREVAASVPGIREAVRGMTFIGRALENGSGRAGWIDLRADTA